MRGRVKARGSPHYATTTRSNLSYAMNILLNHMTSEAVRHYAQQKLKAYSYKKVRLQYR